MNQLAEDDSISEEKDQVMGSNTRPKDRVATGDHLKLVQPGQALLPEGVHDDQLL